MKRYVFITIPGSNLETLYAGFNCPNRGYIVLPFPWEKGIKEISDKKEYYKKRIINELQDTKESICFIVYGRILEWWSVSIPNLLREICHDCTVFAYFGDLIEKHQLDINRIKKECDYVCTFDLGDANKYDLFFCQEPYSGYDLESCENQYDVCFVGRAKDRLDKILNTYSFLSNQGFVCEFYIAEAKTEL